MAINPVPAHYPGFIFDGENSRNYGVYITGVDIYGAPERDTELVTIPGRNGDYNLDRGRWKNIKITYECAMGADTEADFLTGIDAFRNMLASRIGYKRLEDEINTGEYRQAVFADGFDVDYIDPKAAAFSVVFECKPQRFLTAGETAQAVTSGGTVTNPTLYPASPQLQVWGYGNIDINGQPLEIISGPIGWRVVSGTITSYTGTLTIDFDDTLANPGDAIGWHWDPLTTNATIQTDTDTAESVEITNSSGLVSTSASLLSSSSFRCSGAALVTFIYGASATLNAYYTATINLTGGATKSFRSDISISYNGGHVVTATQTLTVPTGWGYDLSTGNKMQSRMFGINSSQSALGSPIYFDLDIGEAWKEEGSGIVSVNNAVTIPAKLPTLSPGANTITYDNTITQLKIVPRWWKL